MRLLALDVGEARIGLAVGDTGSTFAFGRGHLKRMSLNEDIAQIAEQMQSEAASLLVIGLPKRTDGKDSAQTERVRDFAAALEATGLDYVFEDERYSSKIATQGINASGLKKKQRQQKGRIDELSAIVILESYLEKVRHS